jgi:hypothetical protein
MYVSILFVFSIVLPSCGAGSSQAAAVAASNTVAIEIIVKDNKSGEPIEDDVLVLVQTVSPPQADDNADDTLRLESCPPSQSIHAWSPGYYIGKKICDGSFRYEIPLESLNTIDNLNYSWVDAAIRSDPSQNCENCHSTIQG